MISVPQIQDIFRCAIWLVDKIIEFCPELRLEISLMSKVLCSSDATFFKMRDLIGWSKSPILAPSRTLKLVVWLPVLLLYLTSSPHRSIKSRLNATRSIYLLPHHHISTSWLCDVVDTTNTTPTTVLPHEFDFVNAVKLTLFASSIAAVASATGTNPARATETALKKLFYYRLLRKCSRLLNC